MVRTQISLDADLYEQAKAEAGRLGVSFAELVRRSLVRTLGPSAPDRPWMRLAGSVASGDPEASATVDEVVYGRDRP